MQSDTDQIWIASPIAYRAVGLDNVTMAQADTSVPCVLSVCCASGGLDAPTAASIPRLLLFPNTTNGYNVQTSNTTGVIQDTLAAGAQLFDQR